MGRCRKSTSMMRGKISKDSRLDRELAENQHKLPRDGLDPPEWLDMEARKEFTRVVEEAARIDLLDNLDLSVLAVYADAWSNYIALHAQIQKQGNVIEVVGSQGNRTPKVNPALTAQEMYVKRIMSASAKLGLATTDRLKLIVPQQPEKKENKFLKLLNA